MSVARTLLIATMALCGLLCSTPPNALAASVSLPAGTLSADELVNLFSDHTVASVTADSGQASISYYAPDGEVRQRHQGKLHIGRWRVTQSGRICLQMEDRREMCRIIVREDGLYKKYIVKKNGDHQHSVTYHSFTRGNPYNL